MRMQISRILSFLAPLAVVAVFGAGDASSQGASNGEFECLIEPKQLVELGSAEQGIIQEMRVERGDIVKRGDVVAKLDTRLEELAAGLAGLKAERDVEIRAGKVRLGFRQSESDRAGILHSKSIVSSKVYDEARIEQQLAQFGVTSAQMDQRFALVEKRLAEARVERRSIRSPVNGIVVKLMMSPGEFVHDQSPLMTIAQVDSLNVEVFVPISYFGTIVRGTKAKVMPDKPVGGVYDAEVSVVDGLFDTASGTFGVRLTLDNADYRLPAGAKCKVQFTSADTSDGGKLKQ